MAHVALSDLLLCGKKGKTTYCHGLSQFLKSTGRQVAVVNLDPANENMPYKCAIDIGELVSLTEVMDELKLGPNGGRPSFSFLFFFFLLSSFFLIFSC